MLLVLSIIYNDPLFPIRKMFPKNGYYFGQAFCESLFMGYLLFVWLVIVHASSGLDASERRLATVTTLDIGHRKFYWPKYAFGFEIWHVLFAEKGYMSVKRAKDPSYKLN